MPRSVELNPNHKQTALNALQRNGFLTQGEFAIHLEMAPSTVSKFFNSKSIYISKFEKICLNLGLDTREMARSSERISDELSSSESSEKPSGQYLGFLSYDESWVGREPLIAELSEVIKSRRIVIILGLTGIGKTALAECLIARIRSEKDSLNLQRANFENPQKANHFATVGMQWLERWGVELSPEERRPDLICDRILDYLTYNPITLLLDSLETLLTASESSYGGVFKDRNWGQFFAGFLSAEQMPSSIIITSQELPIEIVQERYRRRWHRCILTGLSQPEQIALFNKTGLDTSPDSEERNILLRLGFAYRGHPLILRVMIGEIWESFQGNVEAYWYEVCDKIEAVERAVAEAEADATKIEGAADEWKLHVLTRRVRLEVNQQRLQLVFERLKSLAPDAYLLLCVASVYRIPVEVKGWTMQLANFIRRLEGKPCGEERQELALEELHHRFLVEEGMNENHRRTLGQHPLVRSTSLEHYRRSLDRWK